MTKRKVNVPIDSIDSSQSTKKLKSIKRKRMMNKHGISCTSRPRFRIYIDKENNKVLYNPRVYASMLEQEDIDITNALSVLNKYTKK